MPINAVIFWPPEYPTIYLLPNFTNHTKRSSTYLPTYLISLIVNVSYQLINKIGELQELCVYFVYN